MSRKTVPGLPDITVVHEAIRLADVLAAAELGRKPTGSFPEQWMPEQVVLFDYLAQLPAERMVELHALYWLGSQLSSTASAYDPLYRHAQNNLDDGAYYLTMKPLARGLRRGLEKLGLDAGPPPPERTSQPMSTPRRTRS